MAIREFDGSAFNLAQCICREDFFGMPERLEKRERYFASAFTSEGSITLI